MSIQVPDANYVYNSLLRCNYFPMVKKNLDEIPPSFTTKGFSFDVANKLIQQFKPRKKGYDQIEFRATRFNNITRLMQIPHPLPYALLCKCISDNWDNLKHICDNNASQVKPEKHNDDRLVIMGEYEQPEASRVIIMDTKFPDSMLLEMDFASSNHYRVTADISSCFHSIYTHSIPWSLVGHKHAKSHPGIHLWYNQLDKFQRTLKRNETQGIPIGPATSNIISELILYKVDKFLSDKGYQFIRFIDDYKCYCTTQEKAEKFLLDLEQELRKYLLSINIKKVLFEKLPLAHRAAWVIALANHLPEKPTARKIADYLDYAINLQKDHPEGSILKYATRSLISKVNKNNAIVYLKYLISIAFHKPIVLPILCEMAIKHPDIISCEHFESILQQHIKFHRSDAICWSLFLFGILNKKISDKLADSVIKTEDCMAIAMLISINQHQEKVINFLNNLDPKSEYDCDKYWILHHELAGCNKFDKYREESGLKYLYDNNIHFVKPISNTIKHLS